MRQLNEDAPVIRVLIIVRSPVMQAGLEAMITRETTIQVVGRASSLTTLDLLLQSRQPDVVVLESVLLTDPDLEKIASLESDVAIALLVEPAESYSFMHLLQSGIRGLLPKDVSAAELILALDAIATGLVVLHPDLSDVWLREMPDPSLPGLPSGDRDAPLTPREIEVLQLLATGLSNKAIARQLNISEHTVKFHISSIFSKLNASSRTEAVAIAMRQGWIFV